MSLDGFRAEYLKDHSSHLPVINKLRKLPRERLSQSGGVFERTEAWPRNAVLQERLEPRQHTWGLSILQRPSPITTPSSPWVAVFSCKVEKWMDLVIKRSSFQLEEVPFTWELFCWLRWSWHVAIMGNHGNVQMHKSNHFWIKYTKNSAEMVPADMKPVCATKWKQKLHLVEQPNVN